MGERLFHTLDPTTRAFEHDGRRFLLTDTVGFIRKLPHQLVEAFKATLEETVLADLLLHVIDGSQSEEEIGEAIEAVDVVLEEIGAGEKPRLVVLNKMDLVPADERGDLRLRHPEAILVSAQSREGFDDLRTEIARLIKARLTEVELLVPFDHGERLSQLHEIAGDLEREDRPDGVLVRALVPAGVAERFADLSVNGRRRRAGRCRRHGERAL